MSGAICARPAHSGSPPPGPGRTGIRNSDKVHPLLLRRFGGPGGGTAALGCGGGGQDHRARHGDDRRRAQRRPSPARGRHAVRRRHQLRRSQAAPRTALQRLRHPGRRPPRRPAGRGRHPMQTCSRRSPDLHRGPPAAPADLRPERRSCSSSTNCPGWTGRPTPCSASWPDGSSAAVSASSRPPVRAPTASTSRVTRPSTGSSRWTTLRRPSCSHSHTPTSPAGTAPHRGQGTRQPVGAGGAAGGALRRAARDPDGGAHAPERVPPGHVRLARRGPARPQPGAAADRRPRWNR